MGQVIQVRHLVIGRVLELMRRHPRIVLSAGFVLVLTLLALLASYLPLPEPNEMNPVQRLQEPSFQQWFGTDRLGRSVLSRCIWGARVSLLVASLAAVSATGCGVLLGMVAGYIGGIDGAIMRTMDAILAIPSLLLGIAFTVLFHGGLFSIVLAISIASLPNAVRLVRSVVLVRRREPYVEAAILLQTPKWRILLRHVLPGVLPHAAIVATNIAATAMLMEAALSFLGAGMPPDVPSWGNMIAQGQGAFRVAPWTVLFPAALLAWSILAINATGDALRDAMDPHLAGNES